MRKALILFPVRAVPLFGRYVGSVWFAFEPKNWLETDLVFLLRRGGALNIAADSTTNVAFVLESSQAGCAIHNAVT